MTPLPTFGHPPWPWVAVMAGIILAIVAIGLLTGANGHRGAEPITEWMEEK